MEQDGAPEHRSARERSPATSQGDLVRVYLELRSSDGQHVFLVVSTLSRVPVNLGFPRRNPAHWKGR